jgi:hypothetical protein
MVDDGDIHFTGTWASSGTYFAQTKDTVLYGSARYLALQDNVGAVPTLAPRRNASPKWSILAVIRAGTSSGTDSDACCREALAAANGAFSIAVVADELAYTALQTAWSGTNGANSAFSIAVAGTNLAQSAKTDADLALAWLGTIVPGPVLNPTNRYLPYRLNGTNFPDSAFHQEDGYMASDQAFQVRIAVVAVGELGSTAQYGVASGRGYLTASSSKFYTDCLFGFGVPDPLCRLHVDGALAFVPATQSTVEGDQWFITEGRCVTLVSSSQSTPANSRLHFLAGGVAGQSIIIAIVVGAAQLLNNDPIEGGSPGQLKLNGNWDGTTWSSINLVFDGTNWIETSRSIK